MFEIKVLFCIVEERNVTSYSVRNRQQKMSVVIFDQALDKLCRPCPSTASDWIVGFFSQDEEIYVVDAVPVVDVIPSRSIDLLELDAGFTTQRGILDTILTPLGLCVVGSTRVDDSKDVPLYAVKRGEEMVFLQRQVTGEAAQQECVVRIVSENPIPKTPCATSSIQMPYSPSSPDIVQGFVRDMEDGTVVAVPVDTNKTGTVFNVMKQQSPSTILPCPPSLHISKALDVSNTSSSTWTWTTFFLDSVCFVREPRSIILKQMQYAVQRMLTLARSGRYGPSYHFRTYVFWPKEIQFPIFLVYPVKNICDDDDDDALVWRRAVQVALGLGTQRPFLRIANAITCLKTSREMSEKMQLKNVDQGLPCLNVGGKPVKKVQGDYEYYHYTQDKMDDAGWGCAYRSLQTICSWFSLQGYSNREPPSHREIQATLVSLGDKGKNFIGSKNWIGAIELGYVLDSLYNIQSKIITVADGSNMASVAREIGQHFDTHGTPIMIGGGVLAYTLLGIDYNEDTGDCAFLILDPHYTGSDDLVKIQKGKWVAWKQVGDKATAGGDLFVSGSFYNLLCPQCPRIL